MEFIAEGRGRKEPTKHDARNVCLRRRQSSFHRSEEFKSGIVVPTLTSSLVKTGFENASYHLLVKGTGVLLNESVVLRYLNNINLIHCAFGELCLVYERSKTIFCSLASQPTVAPPKNKSTTVKKKGPGSGKRVKGSPTEDTINRQTTPEPPAGKQFFIYFLLRAHFNSR